METYLQASSKTVEPAVAIRRKPNDANQGSRFQCHRRFVGNWATAGGSNGYRAATVRRPAYAGTDFITARDGWIAALISFSISYPEQLPSRIARIFPRRD